MQITLQEIIKMAKGSFRGMKKSKLSVYYSESDKKFFFLVGSNSNNPTHNNLQFLIEDSHSRFPSTPHKRIMVTWSDPVIMVSRN